LRRLIGIDYGTRRIGIAICDPLRIIASARQTVPNSPAFFVTLEKMISDNDVEAIVVGMPYNLKGEKSTKALEVEEFIEQIKRHCRIEVIEWDERWTSVTAHETQIMMGVKKKDRQNKSKIDEMAAALILQSYLDSHPNSK
jgi:putative Holliday junction resolvase